MAQVIGTPYPGEWDFNMGTGKAKCDGEGFRTYFARVNLLMREIPSHRVVRFHVADSWAYYYVVSLKPLLLQHIPYGDGYEITTEQMFGLKREDVEQMIKYDAGINPFKPVATIQVW